jgi:hypothetical protein
MKRVSKLLVVSILIGLLFVAVPAYAAGMASSAGTSVPAGTNDLVDGAGPAMVVAPAPLQYLTLPNSAGVVIDPNAPTLTATTLTVSYINAYVRRSGQTVLKTTVPVTGGTVSISSSDILSFSITAKYTGVAGTYGMMDLYNIGGTYPMKSVPRVDSAAILASGTATNMRSPPYWFDFANTGTYTLELEIWGGGSLKLVPITIVVS